MAISLESLKSDLFDMLESRGYDPKGLDSTGKETPNPEDSDVIRFELKDQNGISAGQGWIGVELKKNRAEDKKNIVLWIDSKLMKSPEFETFFNLLRGWKRDKNAGFELKTNKGQLVHDMKKRTIMKEKEQLEEGYYPLGKKSSYSDNVPTVKIILQHTRQIEEGEQRFRNVARIFVENANGERFLLPTNRPGLARVFARHVAEGGTPYDDKAKHITTLVEEYTKMAGFVRATKNGQFNESAQRLVNEGISHYQNLRETLSKMTTHRGYVNYFESYTPILNEESDEISLNELFVRETLDPRIESVLPILSRLSKNLNEMNEVKELDEWAQSLIEGGDGGEASEEIDGDTAGNAGEGGAEDVSVNEEEDAGLKKMADSSEVAEVIFQSLKGEQGLNSNDIYSIIDEYESLMSDEGYEVNNDDVAQILLDKLDISDDLTEAPGAETLKHNQNTVKSNLKAFDLAEGGSGDAPIEKMSDSDLADYLSVSVEKVKKNRKAAEQAARDKTEDNLDESGLQNLPYKIKPDDGKSKIQNLPYKIKPDDGKSKIQNLPYKVPAGEYKKIKEEEIDDTDMNTAQKVALMRKGKLGNDITLSKQDFDSAAGQHANNKEINKMARKASDKEGNVNFGKFMGNAMDQMNPAMSGVQRNVNKALIRDLPADAQKMKKNNPEEFEKAYATYDPETKSMVDKALATSPKQAKLDYKAAQAIADKQMTDQGYSKYGYNYQSEPVMGRLKNAGAWVKDKFNEEDEEVSEDLDANQKRAGQLGPTEKVGPKGAVGKLVGANESINYDEDKLLLDRITRLAGK
jgi:hypothetical protein